MNCTICHKPIKSSDLIRVLSGPASVIKLRSNRIEYNIIEALENERYFHSGCIEDIVKGHNQSNCLSLNATNELVIDIKTAIELLVELHESFNRQEVLSLLSQHKPQSAEQFLDLWFKQRNRMKTSI